MSVESTLRQVAIIQAAPARAIIRAIALSVDDGNRASAIENTITEYRLDEGSVLNRLNSQSAELSIG